MQYFLFGLNYIFDKNPIFLRSDCDIYILIMNITDRLLIKSNRSELNSLINLTELIPFLLSKRVFNQKMIDDIMSADNDSKRKERLLIDICKRGPKAFDKLVEALIDTGHDKAVKKLKPGIKLKRTGSLPHNSSRSQRTEQNNNNNNSIEMQVMDNKLKVMPSYDRVISDEVYLMQDYPRGYCFIINNVDFDNEYFKTRFGSDADAKRLDEVFQELGFIVYLKRNLTSYQMMEKCDNLVKKINNHYYENKKRMNAFVLIILSHGQENTVYGSNNFPVDIFELIEKFNNDRCEGLIGSPKMIFIQACRGDKKDFGVNIKTEQQLLGDCESVMKSEATSDAVPTHFITHKIVIPTSKRASWQDVIISYPTVYGYVAMRNPEMGSWYCSHLVDVLLKYSCRLRLIDILCKVENGVRKMQTFDGDKQSTCTELIGWNKRLYFNPGYYKQL